MDGEELNGPGSDKDGNEMNEEKNEDGQTEMRDMKLEQEVDMERTWSSCWVEKEQLMRSERIRAWLMLDVKSLSSKKL